MPAKSSRSTALIKAACALFAGLGLAIVVFGIALDFLLPYAEPGFSLSQLMLVLAGLALSLFSLAMFRANVRRRLFHVIKQNLLKVFLITLFTLVVLEFVLVALGIGTYYPAEIPKKWIEPVPWWRCDEDGCRFVHDEVVKACDRREFSEFAGRRCLVNRQGYQDSGDFVVLEGSDERKRILILGDSFTAGYSADIGKSYVETIEASYSDSDVWNTGMGGTGTNQALASFRAHAPSLRPQITVLGFVMNDYDDNLTPIDNYVVIRNLETNAHIMIRQYWVDVWGNVIKLDLQSVLYYRGLDVDPPANEIKRLFGLTRFGGLVLRFGDALGAIITEDARFNRKVSITRDFLSKLRDESAEFGSELLVLLIPSMEDMETVSARYLTAVELMRELKIPYINPIGELVLDDYVPEFDAHWNNAGHQKIGALLSACLDSFFASGNFAECEYSETP
ncbi:MAG: hypothetical protein OXG60_16395 [Chloroflexi bacterium]|nr:hypothetical protein [Chloroflexota bacterium]